MKESKANKKCMDFVALHCPQAVIYKIADKFTAGIPDTVMTWMQRTWWFEFKMLDPNEGIHKQLDPIQLVECCKLERESGGRTLIVAYRRPAVRGGNYTTILYRPSSLLRGADPRPVQMLSSDGEMRLWQGALSFEGQNHRAVLNFIRETI